MDVLLNYITSLYRSVTRIHLSRLSAVFKERVQKYKSKLALSLQVQFLFVTQNFSLSRARDMLITSFLISSPMLKFTIIL